MLQQWDRQYPGRIETMFSALQILFLLMCDAKLFDFKSIQRGVSLENIEGDIAFDKPDLPTAPLLPDEENDFLEQTQIAFKEVI